MKYFLFVKFDSGLMHNACHATLEAVRESVEQLINEENSKLEDVALPSIHRLKKHLNIHDDYVGYLSNGTWFHIQPQNVFEKIR